jgi:Ca-activated chloride channel family protein
MRKADEWVQKMQADLGGTEMAAPLRTAYRLPAVEGVGRRIVLITDGQVSNEDDLIRMAKKHAGKTQVFAFGVGYGASEHLVRGVARAGRGAAEMIYAGEKIDDKVLRHFHRMTGRALSDVDLSFEGMEVADVLPRDLPPLWANEPVTFFLRVVGNETGVASLRARVGDQDLRLEAPVPSTLESPGAVPVLWARRRIRELEESDPWTLRRGSSQSSRKAKKIEAERKKTEEQLVELGRTFGLVSAATSYVLIDERPEAERADTRARLVRVPGQLTRGWHGIHDTFMGALAAQAAPGLARSMFAGFRVMKSARHAGEATEGIMSADFAADLSGAAFEHRESATPPSPADPVDDLALQITAAGYWSHSPEVFKVTGLTKARVAEISADLRVSEALELVTTLAILRTMERRSEAPAQWKPLLTKARKWVKKITAGIAPPHGATWESWLESELASG